MDSEKSTTDIKNNWEIVWETFHRLRDSSPSERAILLKSLSPELSRELQELLAADENSGEALENLVSDELHFLQEPFEPEPPTVASGELLAGRFEIRSQIGKGGMGAVYEAFDRELGTTLALKIMHGDLALDASARDRFHREINLARQITHPHACRIFDIFRHEEMLFLTMELLPGETLREKIRRDGRMSPSDAMPIVLHISQALSAIHHSGIVHRDLKSSNIILVPQEAGFRTVVTDFGLAISLPGKGSLHVTEVGQVLGTPQFMAPEQLTRGTITPATDVYAFGLVMYEMVTGELPLAGESSLTIAAKRISEDAPSPRQLVPDLDRNWERTILRCLERNPKHRFQKASEVAEALKGNSITTRIPVLASRHRTLQVVRVSILLVLLLLALIFWRNYPFSKEGSRKDMVTRRLWTGATGTPPGILSTDGKILIDVDWQTADLAAIELATGEKQLLTKSGIYFFPYDFSSYPNITSLSPNGKEVAYSSTHVWDPGCDLKTVHVSGSEPHTLYSSREVCPDPADWSSDGKKILSLFRNKNGSAQIALVSTENGSVRPLKSLNSADVHKISLSPNGQYAAYDFPQGENSANHDVFLLALKDGSETRLVAHMANDYVLGWSPDGKKVLFASDRSGTYDAWILNADEGTQKIPELVRKDIGQIFPLKISADGSFYYSHLLTSYDLYTATFDPSKTTNSIHASKFLNGVVGSNANADFSPDGKELIFNTVRNPISSRWSQSAPMILKILSLETNAEREFASHLKTAFGKTRWSRDGRSILSLGDDGIHGGGLYLIDLESGSTDLVVRNPENNFVRQFQWAADSRAFYYMMNKGGVILAQDISTGRQEKIYSGAADFDVSRDGKWLAIIANDLRKGDTFLKIVAATGGEPKEILQIKMPEWIPTLAWTPDGNLLFAKGRRDLIDDPYHIYKISRNGGPPLELGIVPESVYNLRIHPDGQRIVVGASTDTSELWVMEDFLPKPSSLTR